MHTLATGKVVRAFGNLLHVEFEGNLRQGEVSKVLLDDQVTLLAEVIEVANKEVKLQVFEDTRMIRLGTEVSFLGHLLEAELGPGLLSAIYDGLQNPLEDLAKQSGIYLKRGVYLSPLDREKKWEFTPKAKVGDKVKRGDVLGTVPEERFTHKIMVPFAHFQEFTLTWVAKHGTYAIEECIAKAKNAEGQEIEWTMLQRWPVKQPLIEGHKTKPQKMMSTGLRTLDTQFPIAKGGSFCSPGPFGAGKTVLQHHLSKYSSVDMVVVVACGERAGEVVEMLRTFPSLTDPHTQEPLSTRTVMICNTSSMPVSAREASVYMGVTIAEYYRQMGYDILMLADSTSRWAQAMREMSGRLEEIPGEEAFPAYLSSRIASFYERSGVIQTKDQKFGSLTIGGSVSPAGGNFEEPVTQSTLSVVGAFHGLSRARSDARRYPAIDPLISWSKYLPVAAKDLEGRSKNWLEKVQTVTEVFHVGDEIGKRMEVVGEEGTSIEDMVIYLKMELLDHSYLQQNAFDKVDAYCPLERQIELFELIYKIFKKEFHFQSHDAARSFFLELQSEVKNLNYLDFQSENYTKKIKSIEQTLESAS